MRQLETTNFGLVVHCGPGQPQNPQEPPQRRGFLSTPVMPTSRVSPRRPEGARRDQAHPVAIADDDARPHAAMPAADGPLTRRTDPERQRRAATRGDLV